MWSSRTDVFLMSYSVAQSKAANAGRGSQVGYEPWLRRQLLPRLQFPQSVARDPARGGGIDGADVLGGGDGRAAKMRIALADGAQGPVHPLPARESWGGGKRG